MHPRVKTFMGLLDADAFMQTLDIKDFIRLDTWKNTVYVVYRGKAVVEGIPREDAVAFPDRFTRSDPD